MKKYYCEYCGAELVKGESDTYNILTGKPKMQYECPRIEEIYTERREQVELENKLLDQRVAVWDGSPLKKMLTLRPGTSSPYIPRSINYEPANTHTRILEDELPDSV